VFLFRLLFLPVRLSAASAKVGYKTGRLLGYRRLVVFGSAWAWGSACSSRR
jgi:hypothetical protein